MNISSKSFCVALTIIMVGLQACGSRPGRPVTSSSSSSDGIACSKSNDCPSLKLQINVEPQVGGQLRGVVNQEGVWMFRGVVDGGAGRDIQLHGLRAPRIGSFTKVDQLTTKVIYRSLQAMAGPEPIVLVLRDVSLCKYLNPDKAQACGNLIDKTSFSNLNQFQKEASFNWTITETPNGGL